MELEEAQQRLRREEAICESAYEKFITWAQRWDAVETELANSVGHDERTSALTRQSQIRFGFISARDSYEDAMKRVDNAQTDLDEARSADPLYALLYGED